MSIPLSLFPVLRWFDDNGLPLAFGLIYSRVAGTSTPLNTYADVNMGAANTNPLVLDASGRGQMWMLPSGYDIFACAAADPVPVNPTAPLEEVLGWSDYGAVFAAGYGTIQATGGTGVTLPYTVLPTDNSVTIALASGAGAMQLPACTVRSSANGGNGLPLLVFNFSANACTLTPAGADTINGNATLSLAAGKVAYLITAGISAWLCDVGTTA